MSLWQVVGEESAAFALLLSEAIRRSPIGYLHPLGVGAFVLPEAGPGRPQIGIYLNALALDAMFVREPGWIRLEAIRMIRERLFQDFSPDFTRLFLERGWAFVGPPPALQARTGDAVLTSASLGTLGAEVSWGSSHGLITAGHVGGAIGSVAYEVTAGGSAQQIGSVVFSHTAAVTAAPYPGTQGAGTQGAADVCVVELSAPAPPGWGGKRQTILPPLAQVEVLRTRGPARAAVKGMFAWLAFPGTTLVFGNTYMTDTAITQQGDSGALAIDPGSGDVVGHVVGATTNVASYVQEIDFQLQAIRAHGPFANLRL